MKVRTPSVRLLVAALAAFLLIPVAAGANGGAPQHSSTPTPQTTLSVAMTAYNAVPEQTSSHPNITASGAFSNPSIVAARSQDLASELPFGTVIQIVSASSSPTCGYGQVSQQIGLRVIADTMNAKMHDKIDILLPEEGSSASGKTENPAVVLGLCKNVTIRVVGHINVNEMPINQAQLASALDASSQLAVAK